MNWKTTRSPGPLAACRLLNNSRPTAAVFPDAGKGGAMRIQMKTVLCATDFSDLSSEGVSYAVDIAEEMQAKLIICHVVDMTAMVVYGDAYVNYLESQNASVAFAEEEITAMMAGHPVAWETCVRTGHTADEIAALVQEKDVDMAVVATHGRSGVKRLVLGSVTERLMRTLECPILVIRSDRNGPPAKRERFNPTRIMVGCDFSNHSKEAFRYGTSLAQEFESEIHLVHVIEPMAYKDLMLANTSASGGIYKNLNAQLKEKVEGMVTDEVATWCTVHTALPGGHPDVEIVRYARENKIDLVVMGMRGRGIVERLLLGSTTDRVVRYCPCPVLSVSSRDA
jgi:nucleotide-binding universal stress UspA family protein